MKNNIKELSNMLSELLNALGFSGMANDVLQENDITRLRKYAIVVVKNSPQAYKMTILNKLILLDLA